jgi:hypothetical protein
MIPMDHPMKLNFTIKLKSVPFWQGVQVLSHHSPGIDGRFDQHAINVFIKAGDRLSSPKSNRIHEQKIGTHYGLRITKISPPSKE